MIFFDSNGIETKSEISLKKKFSSEVSLSTKEWNKTVSSSCEIKTNAISETMGDIISFVIG
jgi:hypothetical protein